MIDVSEVRRCNNFHAVVLCYKGLGMQEMMNRTILLYDGDCGLCSWSVRFILRFEKEKHLIFSSLQSDFAKRKLKILGVLNVNLDSVILIKKNRVFTKSKALLELSRFLKFPFNVLVIFKLVPVYLADWVYDLVARNRHVLFKSQCGFINKEELERFVK